MQITFQRELQGDVINDSRKLWKAHWEETEGYRSGVGYQPDEGQLFKLDELGQLRIYTARGENNILLGHLCYITHISRHTSKPSATEDYFYVIPEARGSGIAMRLLKFAINDLRQNGYTEIGMSEKITNPIGPLLKRVGFKHVANFYVLADDGSAKE